MEAVHRGRVVYTHLSSYAPRLEIETPNVPETCSSYVLVPLPSAVYFDPYTAQLDSLPAVRDVFLLGQLDLEKPQGWSDMDRATDYVEEVPRMWWEGAPSPSTQTCHGDECEHAALLVALDGTASTKISVPLHMRYLQAMHWPNTSRLETYDLSWITSATMPAQLPASLTPAWHAAAALVHRLASRGLQVASYLDSFLMPHYDRIHLAKNAPIFFATCEQPTDSEWDPADIRTFLPDSHQHLLPSLQQHLAYQTYTASLPAIIDSEAIVSLPVGDATKAGAVQIATFAAILVASIWLCRAIFRVRV